MDQDLVPPRSSSRPTQLYEPTNLQDDASLNNRGQRLSSHEAAQNDATRWSRNETGNTAHSRTRLDHPGSIAVRSQRTGGNQPHPGTSSSHANRFSSLDRPENQRSESSDSATSATRKRVASTAADNPFDNKRTQNTGPAHSAGHNDFRSPGSSLNHPIDLTNSPPRHRTFNMSQGQYQYNSNALHHSPEPIHLPPWQPDADVTTCPVCGTAFGFLYRKHHCRKCGRVVCDGCSRHRIGLPRRYIVQPPPGVSSSPFMSTISALGMPATLPGSSAQPPSNQVSSGYGRNFTSPTFMPRPGLTDYTGGAEVVRVCNPCVPDPNLSPPPQTPVAGPHQAYPVTMGNFPMPSGSPRPLQRRDVSSAQFRDPIVRSNMSRNNEAPVTIPQRRGSGLQGFGSSNANQPLHVPRDHTYSSNSEGMSFTSQSQRLRRWGLDAGDSSLNSTSQSVNQSSPLSNQVYPYRPHSLNPTHESPLATGFRRPRGPGPSEPPTLVPRREIPEEDECPVCGRELPPIGPNNDTGPREAHIESCIQSHSYPSSTPIASSAPQPQVSASNESLSGVRPRHSSQVSAGVQQPPNAPAAGPSAMAGSPQPASLPPSLPTRPARNRMIVYSASEKDCTGDDGEPEECIICFEEFEPGVEMGRLECWCKFHRTCITQWWETKGPGSCPLHQLHE